MSLHILVMNSRNNDRRHVDFDRLPVSIGRHEYNSLQLLDPGVSRFHASIEWTAARIVITDLGSVNGTFYGGLALPACEPTTIDGEQFSIAVGPFHLAVKRRLPARASIAELEATRVIDPLDLDWLRRPSRRCNDRLFAAHHLAAAPPPPSEGPRWHLAPSEVLDDEILLAPVRRSSGEVGP